MLRFLWFVIALAAFSVGASAQGDSLMNAYSTWKETRTVKLTGNEVHYGFAVSTQKTSADRGSLEFMPVGDISKLTIKMTPMTIERDDEGNIVNQIEGETAIANQPTGNAEAGVYPRLKIVLPIQGNPNAVRVVWEFTVDGEKTLTTILLPLDSEKSAQFIGITPGDTPVR